MSDIRLFAGQSIRKRGRIANGSGTANKLSVVGATLSSSQAEAGSGVAMSQDGWIYLDYNATTPCDSRVIASMLPFFSVAFGNAASHHRAGREAEAAVSIARQQVGSLLGVTPREVIWTSGATEGNNLAIKGVAYGCGRNRERVHLVTQATEHKAVLDPFYRLGVEGFQVTVLPVDSEGRLDPDVLRRAIRADTVLVSTMWGEQRNRNYSRCCRARESHKGCKPARLLSHGRYTGSRSDRCKTSISRRGPAHLLGTQNVWPERMWSVIRAAE